MTNINDHRAARARIAEQAKTILTRAERENRDDLSGSEAARYDALMADLEKVNEKIRSEEFRMAREREQVLAYKGYSSRGEHFISHEADGARWFPTHTEYRAMSEGTNTAGGFLVPEGQSDRFLDRLAAATVVLRANPRVFRMDERTDTLNVPKIGTSATAAMTAENASITASDIVLEQVKLAPKKLAALVLASNELWSDSNPAAADLVAFDLTRTMAIELDRQFLTGAGTGSNLKGIRNFTGATVTELGSGNGATLALDDIASAIERIEVDNGTASAIFMNPRDWGTLRKKKDTQNHYLLQPDPTEDSRRQLFGVDVFLTSQIPTNLTVGTSTDCSYVLVADMSQVVVGVRQDVRLVVSQDFKFQEDQVAVRVTSRWDIANVNEEGAEVITGVRP